MSTRLGRSKASILVSMISYRPCLLFPPVVGAANGSSSKSIKDDMPCRCLSASCSICLLFVFACRTVSGLTDSTSQMRCMTPPRHLSRNVRALLRNACICVDSMSRCLALLAAFAATDASSCGSSKLIRFCDAFGGADGGLVAVEGFVSWVLSGSNVAIRSARIESMQSSMRRASSTRRAGVSRTEVSEAPSSFGALSGPAPDMAPATLESMLDG